MLSSAVAGCGGTGQPAASSSAIPPATSQGTQATGAPTAPTTPAAPTVVDLYVADQTKPCTVGPKPRACLQLRWNPDEPWEPSWNDSSSIAGFQYQAGYFYHLRVEKTPLPYPPPDAPQYKLRLVEVVEKRPAG